MEDYMKLLKRARKNLPSANEERFEMPFAIVQTVGRHAVIKNFYDIAKTLRRDPQHLAKFLFKEMAVPGDMKGNELSLHGKFSSHIINQRIREYAKEFVMCHECGKPDTIMTKEGRLYIMKCEACGARRSV